MSNSLIPHTFVPGTKAKAQEVNANFIALAEEIQDTQSTASAMFTQVHNEVAEAKSEIAEDYSDVDMTNTKMLTNVILEAPNGIITCDTQTITAKNGLRVLIPSGCDNAGRYTNVDYTLSADVSKTITTFYNCITTVFLDANGALDVVSKDLVFYSDTSNTTNGAYKYTGSKWYKYSSAESLWQETSTIPVADVVWSSGALISSVKPYPVSKVITTSDFNNAGLFMSLLSDDLDMVKKLEKVDSVIYKYYKSGFVEAYGYATVTGINNVATRAAVSHSVTLPFSVDDIYFVSATPITKDFTAACESLSGSTMNFIFRNVHTAAATMPAFYWHCIASK